MLIRQATVEDISVIVSLGRHLLELHSEFDLNYYELEQNFDELFGKWVREQINSNFNFILVAEEQTIVGFIAGFTKWLYPWFKVKQVGHISYLVVIPVYRKKGVGKLLEKGARDWFTQKGLSYVEVYVDEKNEVGAKAWSSFGFGSFKKFLRKRI